MGTGQILATALTGTPGRTSFTLPQLIPHPLRWEERLGAGADQLGGEDLNHIQGQAPASGAQGQDKKVF